MNQENSDERQLEDFLLSLGNAVSRDILDQTKPVIDISRAKTFTKKMLLLQWLFFEKSDMALKETKMYDNALSQQKPDGLINRFRIKENIGTIAGNLDEEETRGIPGARTEMNNLVKEEQLFLSQGKNKILTPLGNTCANFIYFKILERLLGIEKLWTIIKSDLTKKELQNVDPNITIEDFEQWFIIEQKPDGFAFSSSFKDFIAFLQSHPELYQSQAHIIIENLLAWTKNIVITNLDEKDVRLTVSGNSISSFKRNLKDIDWIFKLHAERRWSRFDLMNWLLGSMHEEPNLFLLISPAGYGKTIFLLQFICEILAKNDENGDTNQKFIPLYFQMKDFQIHNGSLYNRSRRIFDTEFLDQNSDIQTPEQIFEQFIGAFLTNYAPNEVMLKILRSLIWNFNIFLIFDGWDELEGDLEHYLKTLIQKIFRAPIKVKGIVSSRYTTTLLQDGFQPDKMIGTNPPENKSKLNDLPKGFAWRKLLYYPVAEKDIKIHLSLPDSKESFKYIELINNKFTDQEEFEKFQSMFGKLTPLDLFLVTLFPGMTLPKHRTQLFERWIYYMILNNQVSRSRLAMIKTNNDLLKLLGSIKIKRDLDGKDFLLPQLIEGSSLIVNDIDYTLLNILQEICYFQQFPNEGKELYYHDIISINPIAKDFIRPIYFKDPNRLSLIAAAGLQDFHFFGYFLAKAIFRKAMNGTPFTPAPYDEIEKFLIDFYEREKDNSKIKEIGIQSPEHFICYLYLLSGVELPPLQEEYKADLSPVTLANWDFEYGKYLMKAFHLEFQDAMQSQDETRKQTILRLFKTYKDIRPTRTFGSYMDEITHDIEADAEPQTNHEPNYYIGMIVDLLQLDKYPKFSAHEIEYTRTKNEFHDYQKYIPKDGTAYWNKQDYALLLHDLFYHKNKFIIPWFYEIFSSWAARNPGKAGNLIDLADIENRFNEEIDGFILINYMKLWQIINPNALLEKIDFILNKPLIDDKDRTQFIDILSKIIIQKIIPYKEIDRETFICWMKCYEHNYAPDECKKALLKPLFLANLTFEQLLMVSKIFHQHDAIPEQKDDEFEYHEFRDIRDFSTKFLLNCLIISHLDSETRTMLNDIDSSDRWSFISSNDLMYEYTLQKHHFFYFNMVLSSNYFSIDELTQRYDHLEFRYAYSQDFDSLINNPQKNGTYTEDHDVDERRLFLVLKEWQEHWWQKHKPDSEWELNRWVEEILKSIDISKIENVIDDNGYIHHQFSDYSSVALTEPEMNGPQFIQMKKILNYVETECTQEFKEEFAEKIFTIIDQNYVKENHFLPAIISFTISKFKTLNEEIRKGWLQKLIKKAIPYQDFYFLFEGITDVSCFYDNIAEGYPATSVFREDGIMKRTGPRFIRDLNDLKNSRVPIDILFFLPFELVDKKVREVLNFDEMQAEYDARIYIKHQTDSDVLNDDDTIVEKHPFHYVLYSYVVNLLMMTTWEPLCDNAFDKIGSLWERYCIYPLIPVNKHPSIAILRALGRNGRIELYHHLRPSAEKMILGLCRYHESFDTKTRNEILAEFKTFEDDIVHSTAQLLLKTDWAPDLKGLLIFFTNVPTQELLELLVDFIKKQKAIFINEYAWEIKNHQQRKSILKSANQESLKNFSEESRVDPIGLSHIFRNKIMQERAVLEKYNMLLSLIQRKIEDYSDLLPLLSTVIEGNYSTFIEKIASFGLEEYSYRIKLLDENKFSSNYDSTRSVFLEETKKIEKDKKSKEAKGIYLENQTPDFLSYFQPQSATKFEDINDKTSFDMEELDSDNQETNPFLDQVKAGIVDFSEIIEYINKDTVEKDDGIQNGRNRLDEIANCILPSSAILENLKPSDADNVQIKYQSDLFWLLVNKAMNDEEQVKYHLNTAIEDGISDGVLNEWYERKPNEIPIEFISTKIDPLILKHVAKVEDIDRIPSHLRVFGLRQVWYKLIFPPRQENPYDYSDDGSDDEFSFDP